MKLIMQNSLLPDYIKPLYMILFSGKFNDTYIDICEKWTFEDVLFAQEVIKDYSLIESIK